MNSIMSSKTFMVKQIQVTLNVAWSIFLEGYAKSKFQTRTKQHRWAFRLLAKPEYCAMDRQTYRQTEGSTAADSDVAISATLSRNTGKKLAAIRQAKYIQNVEFINAKFAIQKDRSAFNGLPLSAGMT